MCTPYVTVYLMISLPRYTVYGSAQPYACVLFEHACLSLISFGCFVWHFINDGLRPFLFMSLFVQDRPDVTCMMCTFTASRPEKMESLSAGGTGWQVSRVSGRQAGGSSTLDGQNIDARNWAAVVS